MFEITLPCCDTPALVDPAASDVRCEACGLVLDLAPDAREASMPVTVAALPVAA